VDKDSHDFGNMKLLFHSLSPVLLQRAGSAASDISVMPKAEGDPSPLIAIPLISFSNRLVKMTLHTQKDSPKPLPPTE